MTTVTKIRNAWKVNERTVIINKAQDVTADGSGYGWIIPTGHITYKVFGGKKSGGAANEWFLEDLTNEVLMPASSAVRAFEMIDRI